MAVWSNLCRGPMHTGTLRRNPCIDAARKVRMRGKVVFQPVVGDNASVNITQELLEKDIGTVI